MRIAILDDYQGVALEFADWPALGADIEVFREHLADADAVVAALDGFDVVVAMRERTPFPRAVLRRLPRLRLLVTTGMRNAARTSPRNALQLRVPQTVMPNSFAAATSRAAPLP